jgi:hypothetical protein
MRVRLFLASVSYRNTEGTVQEEEFPVYTSDYASASNMAFTYVLQVFRLTDFELRIVGV